MENEMDKNRSRNNENCLQNDTLGLSDTRRLSEPVGVGRGRSRGATPRTPNCKSENRAGAPVLLDVCHINFAGNFMQATKNI